MNWKIYKQSIEKEGYIYDESKFILGLDIGSATAMLSFYNGSRREAELIDMSGGYGTPGIPSVMQYIPETKEWTFGEYALLNKGYFNDITVTDLIGKIESDDFIDINGKLLTAVNALSRFLKEIIGFCKNIDPNAETAGIVCTIPTYMTETAKEKIIKAFTYAGFQKELICLMTQRECVFRHARHKGILRAGDTVMLLDYGNQCLSGGVFEIKEVKKRIHLDCIAYLYDETLGVQKIDETLKSLFDLYCMQECSTCGEQYSVHLENFVYQNKNVLFHSNLETKPAKLYFNFCYPPFQKTITNEIMNQVLSVFIKGFYSFTDTLLEKAGGCLIAKDKIGQIICTGGGFEMFWVQKALAEQFVNQPVQNFKNAQGVSSLGAAAAAAGILGLTDFPNFICEDDHILKEDIGFWVFSNPKEKFAPVLERNFFWWEQSKSQMFILNQDTYNPVEIEIVKRNEYGDVFPIETLTLSGLPKRPRGATRLRVSMRLDKKRQLLATIKDFGFGELFPSSDFEKTYAFLI